MNIQTLIEQLAEPNPLCGRGNVSIAYRLVTLGHFEQSDDGLAAALSVVDRVLGTPHGRN